MDKIQLLLVDDHEMFRSGIRALLEDVEDFAILAEARDGVEAWECWQSYQPDVTLLDLMMPRLNGLELLEKIQRSKLPNQIICLSMHSDGEYIQRAWQLGAAGYLLKTDSAQELEKAIRTVAKGEKHLTSSISQSIIDHCLTPDREGATSGSAANRLSMRKREILKLIAEGHSSKEIASILKLSVKTVEMHRSQLMKRLNIHGIAGLTCHAIKIGLVTP